MRRALQNTPHEDCPRGDISWQLQRFKELGGFGATHRYRSCGLLAAVTDRERQTDIVLYHHIGEKSTHELNF